LTLGERFIHRNLSNLQPYLFPIWTVELIKRINTRWRLHLLFWLAYLTLETYFEFAWIRTSFKELSYLKTLFLALSAEMSILPHKLGLTYITFWILERKDKASLSWWESSFGILFAFGLAVVVQRFVAVYWVLPVLYAEASETQYLFDINRVNSSVGDLLFVVGLATAIKQYRVQQRTKEHERNLNKEKLEAELRFLRNQTNPHFLFNTLNNIYALARKKADETPEVILKLSQLLRFMLYECKREQIAIYEEIKVIEDYISLEKIRYQNKLVFSFKKEIDQPSESIAPLILLPFVENAFKHGAGESRFGAYIALVLILKEGVLEFTITNSKEEDSFPAKEGIGLGNVKRQLELIYKDFDLQIENEADRFVVKLYINLRNHAKL
jgi:sensor histidine kinase YesM